MADEQIPGYDPGNSDPEYWTENLHEDEVAEVTRLLADEFGEAS